MNISLSSPQGKEQPSTVQWDVTIPAGQLNVDDNPQPGPQAKAAGKSITCRVKTKTETTQTFICLVFGGREPIHDGVIALLQFRISDEARPGPVRVRLDEALAVLKDLKRIPIDPIETIVTIREN